MFERLLTLFNSPAPRQALPEPDAKLALGTLLVRTAMADKAYVFEEVQQIDKILAAANALNPIEAARMRATCEELARQLPDDTDLAVIIRDSVDYAERLGTVEALWRVVLADGVTDTREAALVDLVEDQLGVARSDSEAARAAAVIP